MKIFLKNLIKLENLNNLILILLVFSFFRYHKPELSFNFFGSYNPIKFFGEMAFLLLLFFSFFYLFDLNKKIITYLLIIISGWSILSVTLNYNLIDLDYIKKSFQFIYCIYLFFVFSNIKTRLNLKTIESLLIIIIVSTIFLNLFYSDLFLNLSFFNLSFINLEIKFLILILILFFVLKRNKFYIIISTFLTLLFLYKLNFNEYPNNFSSIEIFTRQNSFSWMILCLFSLILFFDFRKSNVNRSVYLFLIIIFSLNFVSTYILVSEFFLLFLFLTNIYFKNFLKTLLILFLILIFLYLYLLILQTDLYIYLLQAFFNFFGEPNAYGIISVKDENYYFIYELSSISQKNWTFLTEIYYGLIHRAVIAKVYLANIFNKINIDTNYQLTTYKNFIVLDNDIVIPNEMKRFEYYAPFLEKCGELSIRGTNCFNQTGLFNGYVVSNIDKFFSIHDINNDSSFNHLSIFNQNFNSPHNQYFGLLSNFGFLGLLIISISVYVFFKKILNKKNNLLFCIFILNLFIILNFDDYLFYNFFNVSYFLWLIIGLTCNKNLVIR